MVLRIGSAEVAVPKPALLTIFCLSAGFSAPDRNTGCVLKIRDPAAHRLARELADIKGTSITEAVTSALRAALTEHGRRRIARRRALRRLVPSAREVEFKPGTELIGGLYDTQSGLPR